jgi:Holliday junction resolvase RusA-like endonuclease
MRAAQAGGRLVLLPSKAYEEYAAEAAWHVKGRGMGISEPVNIRAVYYMRARRKVDLLNLLAGTMDLLARLGVIADDCRDIAAAHDGSRVLCDKGNPRAEITIARLPGHEQWGKWGPCEGGLAEPGGMAAKRGAGNEKQDR